MVIVETSLFSNLLGKYLSDDEYIALKNEIASNPGAGNLIPGTGGLRKIRFSLPGKGKGRQGGVRVIYYWYFGEDRIYLLSIYYKGEVTDLTAKEKKFLKQLVEKWKDEQA